MNHSTALLTAVLTPETTAYTSTATPATTTFAASATRKPSPCSRRAEAARTMNALQENSPSAPRARVSPISTGGGRRLRLGEPLGLGLHRLAFRPDHRSG